MPVREIESEKHAQCLQRLDEQEVKDDAVDR